MGLDLITQDGTSSDPTRTDEEKESESFLFVVVVIHEWRSEERGGVGVMVTRRGVFVTHTCLQINYIFCHFDIFNY